jgi:hypothetical protein
MKTLNYNFWKWFGNSKVIENNKPLILYHGTNENFNVFDNSKIGIDISDNLLPHNNDKRISFQNEDLNSCDWDVDNACLVYSIFTMQFLKKSQMFAYLQTIHSGLIQGGALFLCEKIYQDHGAFQEVFSFSHYDYKSKNFNPSDIYSKEKDNIIESNKKIQ